jgi:hypothetical protein
MPGGADARFAAGDFDGDGRTDIAIVRPGSVEILRSTGLSFERSIWSSWPSAKGTRFVSGDFDGDCKTDLVRIEEGHSADVWLHRSSGTQLVESRLAKWRLKPNMPVFVGDVNGDRVQDLVKFDPGVHADVWVQHGLARCPGRAAKRAVLEPGQKYKLRYGAPIDRAPTGAVWEKENLQRSILEPMFRAVILKADDLTASLSSSFARYLTEIADRDLASGLGIVAEGVDKMDGANVACLRRLDAHRFEIFDHGLDHADGEFKGTPLDQQVAHLKKAQSIVKETLGITMHAFGAPENSSDDNTRIAIERNSDLEIIFFGPMVPDRTLLHGEPSGEPIFTLETWPTPRLQVKPLSVFRAEYEARCFQRRAIDEPPPACAGKESRPYAALVFQLHPNSLSHESWSNLARVLEFLAVDEKRAFLTPSDYARFLKNRDRITITKTASTAYVLDLSRAVVPLVIALPEQPKSIAELPR